MTNDIRINKNNKNLCIRLSIRLKEMITFLTCCYIEFFSFFMTHRLSMFCIKKGRKLKFDNLIGLISKKKNV